MSRFLTVYEPTIEGIITGPVMWAITKLTQDQKRVDAFFNKVGHQDDFILFADYLFANIKTQYKSEIFMECPEKIWSDKYSSMMPSHGKFDKYYVFICGYGSDKNIYTDKKIPASHIGEGIIVLFDYRKRGHTDLHTRMIPFYIDKSGWHTIESYGDTAWLIETKRVKLPYTQKFNTLGD